MTWWLTLCRPFTILVAKITKRHVKKWKRDLSLQSLRVVFQKLPTSEKNKKSFKIENLLKFFKIKSIVKGPKGKQSASSTKPENTLDGKVFFQLTADHAIIQKYKIKILNFTGK